jgi:tol-pal system protein YbgF
MRAVWALVMFAAVVGLLLPAPAAAQDAAELSVRVNRMENQIRQLSGQIEQLQFENRRLTDQLKRFQEDVEFRLSERGGTRPSGAPAAAAPAAPGQPQRPRRNDAFDPGAQPGASGAPRQLGTPATGVIDNGGPGSGQPLDVTGARQPPAAALQPGQRGPQSVVATAPGTPRQSFDAALAAINSRQYEDAEMGFRQFLQSHPRDRLAPNAIYWLGESYFRRSRHKDAAEQYLKVTTDHARTNIAPEAMLKLGMSLNALGARDQACATFAQVSVKYPEAPETVRSGVERERRRVRCDG